MSVIEENWNYKINVNEIDTNLYSKFELQINNICEQVLKALEDGFLIENINYQANIAQTYDEELKLLTESNIQLRQDIDQKLNKLSKKQSQYEGYKKDQQLLSQQIKETHESFLMARKHYKKFLKMYFTIESRNIKTQVIFVQFITEAKKDTDKYSARLSRNTETGQYELLSVTPKLKIFKELQRKLVETNDVPGVMCCLRQSFLAIKEENKK